MLEVIWLLSPGLRVTFVRSQPLQQEPQAPVRQTLGIHKMHLSILLHMLYYICLLKKEYLKKISPVYLEN